MAEDSEDVPPEDIEELPPLERHPDDTDRLHLDLATKAVAAAKPANHSYVFHMPDRVEIAFAQVRSLLGHNEELGRSFEANYHTGISMDFAAAEFLFQNLGNILEEEKMKRAMKEENGPS